MPTAADADATSPSSTTAWATCARWRRRSRTSRPSATSVVTADPAAIRARRRASCCPARARCPTACAASTRAGCATPCWTRRATQPVPRHLPRPADAVRRERGGPDAPGSALLAGRRRALPRRGDDGCRTASGSRCRTWAGTRCARRAPHPLWAGIPDGSRFYFVHSYHPRAGRPAPTAPATADYPAPFTCAIARANIFATQFHPEKSHRAGLAAARQLRRLGRTRLTLASRAPRPPQSAAPPPRPPRPPSLRRHADHSRDRPQGRPLRAPEAGRHAVGDGVLRGPGGDGAALARAGRAAAAPGRPERRRRRQAEERARDPRDRRA